MSANEGVFILSIASATVCLALAVGKATIQKPDLLNSIFTVILVATVLGFIAIFMSPTSYVTHESELLPNLVQLSIAIGAVAVAFCVKNSAGLRTVALATFAVMGFSGVVAGREMRSPSRVPYGYHMARMIDIERAARYAAAFETPVEKVKLGTDLDDHPNPEVRQILAEHEPPPKMEFRQLWHSWFTDLYKTIEVPVRYRIVGYDGKTYTLAAEPR